MAACSLRTITRSARSGDGAISVSRTRRLVASGLSARDPLSADSAERSCLAWWRLGFTFIPPGLRVGDPAFHVLVAATVSTRNRGVVASGVDRSRRGYRRHSEPEVDGRPDRDAQTRAADDVERQVRSHVDARERHERGQTRGDHPDRRREERSGGGRRRGDRCVAGGNPRSPSSFPRMTTSSSSVAGRPRPTDRLATFARAYADEPASRSPAPRRGRRRTNARAGQRGHGRERPVLHGTPHRALVEVRGSVRRAERDAFAFVDPFARSESRSVRIRRNRAASSATSRNRRRRGTGRVRCGRSARSADARASGCRGGGG